MNGIYFMNGTILIGDAKAFFKKKFFYMFIAN